ncbi:hypothetical protein FRC06_009809, partial [Ceratobasidium sp. 370]
IEQHTSLRLKKKTWRLFPSVSIVSANYEEQIIVACNRGMHCLTPDNKMHDLAFEAKPQDPKSFLALLKQVADLNITKSSALLKEQGLQPVQNAFFSLGLRMNIFHALSYDTLHTDDLGQWGKHLWPLLKENMKAEPAEVQDIFNKWIDSVPPWSHTNLIQLIRLQAEIRLIASLQVQTEETIAVGQEHIARFYDVSKACTISYGKNFDFPKMHQLVHLFDDIQAKGVTADFSTKPGKKMHGVLHYAYDHSSKKRGTVDAKVLHKNHVLAAYDLIGAEIDARAVSDMMEEEPDNVLEDIYHVKLASKKRLLTLALLEEQHRGDKAFARLGTHVCACIARLDLLFKFSAELPVKLHEYQTLMVQYESMVDWCLHCDNLWCNPSFHGKERHDCVLVHSSLGVSPAMMLALMDCFETGDNPQHLQLAVVIYFDQVHGPIGEV